MNMASSKLTLSAEKEVIELAKKFAAENGTSVSAMFSSLISSMARTRESREPIGPLTQMASGLIRLPADVPDERLLEDALAEKYGGRT
jgi:hypothetical protein